jgi:hypothetical protein
MGSCGFPIFSVEVKSKWNTCWSLCFARLTTRKLKRKEMCKKHSCSNVVWFCNFQTPFIIICFCNFWMSHNVVRFYNFWTLQLWKVAFRVLKTGRKKEMTMRQIKRWSEKAWCHERRGVTQEKRTRRQTKLWPRRNYLKRIDKDIIKHIDIRGEKDLWKP